MPTGETPTEQQHAPTSGGARRDAIVAISALSMANTIPRTLAGILLPAIHRREGLALEHFWVFAIPLVISPLRVLWAPWVDRLGSESFGRRKSWILPCTVATAATCALFGFLPPTIDTLPITIGMLVVVFVFLATQETAVDAYIVESLYAHERQAGATARVVSEEIGQLLTITGLLLLYRAAGWQVTITTAGFLLLLLSLPALLRREQPVNRTQSSERPSLRDFIARRENLAIVAVIGAAAIAPGLASAIISPFLIDQGLDIGEIGIVLGLSSSLGPILSGLLFVPLLTRGRSLVQAARLQLCLVPISPLLFVWLALTATPSPWQVGLAIFSAAFITTPALILVYRARLAWTSPEQAATDFTTQEAVYVVFRGILPGAIAGPIAALLGWPGFFAFMLIVALVGFGSFVLSVPGIDRRVADRRSGTTLPTPHTD